MTITQQDVAEENLMKGYDAQEPRRLCDSLSKMAAPTQFAEVGSVLTRKLGILKAKLHCGECAITWEVFHGPEEVSWFNLLSHGMHFL